MTADPNQETPDLHSLLAALETQLDEAIDLADTEPSRIALEEVRDAFDDLHTYLAEAEPTESDDEDFDPGEETVPDEF